MKEIAKLLIFLSFIFSAPFAFATNMLQMTTIVYYWPHWGGYDFEPGSYVNMSGATESSNWEWTGTGATWFYGTATGSGTNYYSMSVWVEYPGAAARHPTPVVRSDVVPTAGVYKFVAAACQTKTCSLAQASNTAYSPTWTQDGIKTLAQTTTPLWKQQVYLDTRNKYSSWCIGLIRTSDNKLFGGGYPWSCSDSQIPAPENITCIVNSGNPLDINMGITERSSISTQVTEGISTDVNIYCSAGGTPVNTDTNIRFSYQPMNSTPTSIQTSTTGLGVLLSVNGTTVLPSEQKPVSVINGNGSVNLKFSLIRDSAVPPETIAVGTFSASAIMAVDWL